MILFKVVIINLIILTSHLSESLVVPRPRARDNQAICLNQRSDPQSHVHLCYVSNVHLRSMVIWFITPSLFFETFRFYRFILRSIDEVSLVTTRRYILTNYTELIDRNNSLRLYNLQAGQYELCLEFQSNETWFPYQTSDHCLDFRLGHLSHHSFRQSSTELLLTLTTSIALFLVLGLFVQCRKSQRTLPQGPLTPRGRASSLLSTVSLKKQRERIVRKLFRRHMDQSEDSHIRRWARNRAFRHRISTQESDAERAEWRKETPLPSPPPEDDPSSSMVTINDVYIIPLQEICDLNEENLVI